MLALIALACIGLGFKIGYNDVKHADRKYRIKSGFVGAGIGFIASAIIAAFFMVISFEIVAAHGGSFLKEDYEFPLYAIADGNQTEGDFFLLGGSIDEEAVYRYYYKTRDGGFKQSYFYADKTTIFESERKPHVQAYDTYVKAPAWLWFPFPAEQNFEKKYYHVYVPPGSVLNNYELDLR